MRKIQLAMTAVVVVANGLGCVAASDAPLTMADGQKISVWGEAAGKRAISFWDKRFRADLGTRLVQIPDEYMASLRADSAAGLEPDRAKMPQAKTLQVGTFDIAMNSLDLASRALGYGSLLPFSKSFQWSGIGLALLGEGLEGASPQNANIRAMRRVMDSLQKPTLTIRVLESFTADDPRIQDKTVALRGAFERVHQDLIRMGMAKAQASPGSLELYPDLSLGGPLLSGIEDQASIRLVTEFVHPMAAWRTHDPDAEMIVSYVSLPFPTDEAKRQKRFAETVAQLREEAPNNWYWLWVEASDGKPRIFAGHLAETREFEPPPPGRELERWLKSMSVKQQAKARQDASYTSETPSQATK